MQSLKASTCACTLLYSVLGKGKLVLIHYSICYGVVALQLYLIKKNPYFGWTEKYLYFDVALFYLVEHIGKSSYCLKQCRYT